MNILLVLPKMREIENFDMTNPRDNEQISPVPWHFVKSRFHCMRLCTEAWVCSDLVPSPPPSFPPAHVPPSSLSLIICKCIHLHLRSLCIKADIKVQKRNCTVFCFSVDYTKLLFSTSLWTKVPSLGLGWQWNWKYRDLYEIVFLDLILIYCVCTME